MARPTRSYYHEFPDPLIARFIARIREFDLHVLDQLNQPNRNLFYTTGPLRGRVVGWFLATLIGFQSVAEVALTTWTCSDPEARRLYKDLRRDLRRKGASVVSIARVWAGLNALRSRDLLATERAIRIYDQGVGAILPRNEIGWD